MAPHDPFSWRVITSPPLSGPDNMALDQALMDSVAEGESPPVLRLYAWDPPCLSIGHAQPVAQVLRSELARLGWELVRRPTGGGAILHTDELTYAVAGHQDVEPFTGGIMDCYRRLSTALVAALRELGVEAEIRPRTGPSTSNAICFREPSAYEILAGGKKLIGSAQVRRQGAVLQHGTLPLWGDLGRVCSVLHQPNGADRSSSVQALLAGASTLQNQLGRTVSWLEAARAVQRGLESALGIHFDPDTPSEAELSRARELAATRYRRREWIERV